MSKHGMWKLLGHNKRDISDKQEGKKGEGKPPLSECLDLIVGTWCAKGCREFERI